MLVWAARAALVSRSSKSLGLSFSFVGLGSLKVHYKPLKKIGELPNKKKERRQPAFVMVMRGLGKLEGEIVKINAAKTRVVDLPQSAELKSQPGLS